MAQDSAGHAVPFAGGNSATGTGAFWFVSYLYRQRGVLAAALALAVMAAGLAACTDADTLLIDGEDGTSGGTEYTVATYADPSNTGRSVVFYSSSRFDYCDGSSGTYSGSVFVDDSVTLSFSDGRTRYAATGATLKVYDNAALSGTPETFTRYLGSSLVGAAYRYDRNESLLGSGEHWYYIYYFCADGTWMYTSTTNSSAVAEYFSQPSTNIEIGVGKGTYTGTAASSDLTVTRAYVNDDGDGNGPYPEQWVATAGKTSWTVHGETRTYNYSAPYTYSLESDGSYTTTASGEFSPLYRWQN